jgi:hypothetical protein
MLLLQPLPCQWFLMCISIVHVPCQARQIGIFLWIMRLVQDGGPG